MPENAHQGWVLLGTFLIAFSLLAFEVSTVRTINFSVGPSYIYFAIALAMLGLSAAGSILSLVDVRPLASRRSKILFWTSLGIAALLLIAHFVTADIKAHLDTILEQAGRAGGLPEVARALVVHGLFSAVRIGLILSLPYFLFGALLAFLFATSEGRTYDRLYAADLIGAASGCIGAILLMEATSYAVSVTMPSVAAALAAAAFAGPPARRMAAGGLVAAAALCLVPAAGWYAAAIEPPSDPHHLVRDYAHVRPVEEVWHGWNSYTRVGAVTVLDGRPPALSVMSPPDGDGQPQPFTIMSLSNGEGMAWLFGYEPGRRALMRHRPTQPALLLDPPDDVLVMFAGAGADLMTLHQNAPDRTRVTGVELNSRLVEGALGLAGYRLAEFLARDTVTLEISDGRVFLERDQGRYDVVLYSWNGATAAYYAGALGGTTQFLFTYEGFAAALDHLKPDGYAIVLQVNKVNALAAFRRYLEAREIGDPSRAAVVLFNPEGGLNGWDETYDNNPLLIKPSGWSDEEVARLRENAASYGWQVAYAPGLPPHPDYRVYGRVLGTPDLEAELASPRAETGLRFEVVTDDRPFYLDLFANQLYLDAGFWSRVGTGEVRPHEMAQIVRIAFVALISACALMFILFPLIFRKGPKASARTVSHLTYFFCLGSGFMVLEIVLMQKASLLFGNPGLTIAVVLASVILFSGLGSLASGRTFERGLSFRPVAAGIVLYVLGLYAGLDPILQTMLPWPLAARVLGLAAIVAPGALLLGHLFPQGLALAGRDDPAVIPWAWGINGAMSTVGAGVAPLLAQAWGFNTVFLIAGGLYAVILVLPAYRRYPLVAGADAEPADLPAE